MMEFVSDQANNIMEKGEKCLFTFSHSLIKWRLLCHLTHSHTMTPFENTVGKGEIARNKQFLLFPQCFLPVWITFCHFRQICNCHLQTLSLEETVSIWTSLKSVVW